MQITGSETSPI